jgi:hypothetical protein
MAAPTVAISLGTGGVNVSWVAPDNGGQAIDAYSIQLADHSGTTWTVDAADCDGSSTFSLLNLSCIIPMSSLTAAPYSLIFD